MEAHELDRFERLVRREALLRRERNTMEEAMVRLLSKNYPEIYHCENPGGRVIMEEGDFIAHVGDSGLHQKGN